MEGFSYLRGFIRSGNSRVGNESSKLGVLLHKVVESLKLALHSVESTDLF